MTIDSWIFCHKCARQIWMREISRVGILPCMKMLVTFSWTWKPTYTLARLMVGDQHKVKRRFRIWFRPERWSVFFTSFPLQTTNPFPRKDLPRWGNICSRTKCGPKCLLLGPAPVSHLCDNCSICRRSHNRLNWYRFRYDVTWHRQKNEIDCDDVYDDKGEHCIL